MSLTALILVVSAALFHAVWNLLAKRAAPAGPTFVFAYNLVCCLAYAPWVGLAPRAPDDDLEPAQGRLRAAERGGPPRLQPMPPARLPSCRPVGGLSRGPRHRPHTLLPRRVPAAGREAPSRGGLLGLAAVVVGIGLISTRGELSAFRRPGGGQAGVRWGAATGGLIATYTVVDAYVVKGLGAPPVILDWCSNLLRFVLLTPLVASNRTTARERMRGRWAWPSRSACSPRSPTSSS